MKQVVADASFCRAWILADEFSEEADRLLSQLYDPSPSIRRIPGGSWGDPADSCTVAYRDNGSAPDYRYHDNLGFRLARSFNMVTVEGGILPQGSELAGQQVANFQIGKYEVTWDEWQGVRDWAVENGYSDLAGVGVGSAGNHPVRDVSWYDSAKWCNAKSEKEGLVPVYSANGSVYRIGEFGSEGSTSVERSPSASGYRIPTDAEWEWAARGGVHSSGYLYSGSDDPNEVAWYYGNSFGNPLPIAYGGGTSPVGSKKSNELGIFDMSGNMLEITWDAFSHGGSNARHIARGGWWGYFPGQCSVSDRSSFHPPDSRGNLSLRVAKNMAPIIPDAGQNGGLWD